MKIMMDVMKLVDSICESSILDLSAQLNEEILPIILKLIDGIYPLI
jgi:hypothetical protein